MLELGRRARPKAYGMQGGFIPIIPRDQRLDVPGQIDAPGRAVVVPDGRAVRAVVALLTAGCEAPVVHYLHSYANTAHDLPAGLNLSDIGSNGCVILGDGWLSENREYERGVTTAGLRQVGPKNAGAVPGLVCFRRGGREATISDANLLLGRLDPGQMKSLARGVSPATAAAVLIERIAAWVTAAANPGGFSASATSVAQEGLRLPPVPLFKQGMLDAGIYAINRSSIRVSERDWVGNEALEIRLAVTRTSALRQTDRPIQSTASLFQKCKRLARSVQPC